MHWFVDSLIHWFIDSLIDRWGCFFTWKPPCWGSLVVILVTLGRISVTLGAPWNPEGTLGGQMWFVLSIFSGFGVAVGRRFGLIFELFFFWLFGVKVKSFWKVFVTFVDIFLIFRGLQNECNFESMLEHYEPMFYVFVANLWSKQKRCECERPMFSLNKMDVLNGLRDKLGHTNQ